MIYDKRTCQIFATPGVTPSSKVADREWFHFSALPDLSTKDRPRNQNEPEHIENSRASYRKDSPKATNYRNYVEPQHRVGSELAPY